MEIFLNNNFQELILKLHEVKFLNIAVIHTLVLLAFVGILLFIPFISSHKIKENIMNLTKFIHLLSIIWIVISWFIMKALNYKLPESLSYFFRLKCSELLLFAILILVLFLASNVFESYDISDYKSLLIRAFLNIYLSYVFIFMALEKSVIVLILGLIIISFMSKFLHFCINIPKKTYFIRDDFSQLIHMNKKFYSNCNSIVDSIESMAPNNITIELNSIEHFKESIINIASKDGSLKPHKEYIKTLLVSFVSDEQNPNEMLKQALEVYNDQLSNNFKQSKEFLEVLIFKQLELYDLLKDQNFSEQLNKKFVENYKNGIEAEVVILNQISSSLGELAINEENYREINEENYREINEENYRAINEENYRAINEVWIEQLKASISRVENLKNKLNQVIIELPNS